LSRYDLAKPNFLTNGTLQIEQRGKSINYPIITGTAGFEKPAPLWLETPQSDVAITSPQTGRTVWIYLGVDPDLLARGGELKLHKSQVFSWFGTAQSAREGFIIHGTLPGSMNARLVEINGVKHIQGVSDANLSSRHQELQF